MDQGSRIKDGKGVYGWRFDYPQVINKFSMGVMPSWGRSHNTLSGSTPVMRDAGAYYKKSWDHIIKNAPCNVVITSWDDWAEETAIAPLKEWGNLYYDLTKTYIKKFKLGIQ